VILLVILLGLLQGLLIFWLGDYSQSVTWLYLISFLIFLVPFLALSRVSVPLPSLRIPAWRSINNLSLRQIWCLYLIAFFFCCLFYLSNGASFFNTSDSFEFKTRLNATPLGALASRIVRFQLPLLGLALLGKTKFHVGSHKHNKLVGIFLLVGLVATSLTGFKGYLIAFYVTPLFFFLAPAYTPALKHSFSGKVKRQIVILFLSALFLASSVFYLTLVNTRNLYQVQYLEALTLVVERLTSEQTIGTYTAIVQSTPFNFSSLGSSLSAELCNIFSKITLGLIYKCSSLSAHRMISGSETSAVAIDIIGDSLINFGFPIGPVLYGSIYGIITSKARRLYSLFSSSAFRGIAPAFSYPCLCIFCGFLLIGIGSNPISILFDFSVCLVIAIIYFQVFALGSLIFARK